MLGEINGQHLAAAGTHQLGKGFRLLLAPQLAVKVQPDMGAVRAI